MAPNFGLGNKKKKKKVEGEFGWFETAVNGSAVILTVLTNAASLAPVPYLRNAAATTLSLIQIGQNVKDNKADFRRLCEDAATLMAVVYQSYEHSENPDRWPGPGLEDAVTTFLNTLTTIEEFARAQQQHGGIVRVMNNIGDGKKIKEFREKLGQAISRFEVRSHLQSYDILYLVKNMVQDYQKTLNEKAAAAPEINHPLPATPADTEDTETQLSQDAALAEAFAATEQRHAEQLAAEREARIRELEVVNEKLQQIVVMLENAPPPANQSPAARDDNSSDEDAKILKMTLQHATEKRADRESSRRDRDIDAILSGRLGGLNLNGPGYSGYSGRGPHRGPVRQSNRNSGNVNSTTVYGSHNDNSTVTRIHKVK